MNKQQSSEKSKIGTQERLLETAVDVFGKHGFEAATTRMIAREAGVNIAAIPYYFSGKEGLYHAAVRHIVGKIEAKAAPAFQKSAALPSPKDLTREEAIDTLETLLVAIINIMVGSSEGPRAARIILREQIDPSSAYDIIFTRIMGPIIDTIAKLLTGALRNVSPRSAKLRAFAILGQVMAFRVARETAVRSLGVEGYSPEETEEIRDMVLEHTRELIEAIGRPGRNAA